MLPQSNGQSALVVETNYLLASAVEAPLISAGFRVEIATCREEAFEALERTSFQLALLDFRQQHSEPGGLVAKLEEKGIPFIFCTAASAEEVHEYFPGVNVMLKPFSDEVLLATIGPIVSRRTA